MSEISRDDFIKSMSEGTTEGNTKIAAVIANKERRLFFIRTERVTIANTVAFWLKLKVPDKKKVTFLKSTFVGRGLGQLSIDIYDNPNAIVDAITPIVRNNKANPADLISEFESKLEATQALGGVLLPQDQNELIFFGDPDAATPARVATTEQEFLEIPRIIENDSGSDIVRGFLFTCEGGATAAFDGYIEIEVLEEDC